MTKNYIIVSDQLKLAYVNSPRNGCTTVKSILASVLGIKLGDTIFTDIHRLFRSSAFETFHQEDHIQFVPEDYLRFSIVRNPFDRVVSFYEGKIRQDDKNHKRRFYGVDRDVEFAEFVKKLARRGRHKLGTHLCPQYIGLNVPQLDTVVRFESFTEGLQPIMDYIGYEKPIPHLNDSKRKPYQTYYNTESRDIVKELYADDLYELKYTF